MFPLRQIVSNTSRLLPVRFMSSKGPLVDVAVDNEGITTLTLQRPPVNSLNLELLDGINKSLEEVTKNRAKGLIITSSSPTVFSAGLDIMEMYKPDLQRLETFWTTLQEVWLKLFGSSVVTAAAVNGHSPAGGCLLATSCEYRAMVTGKYTIGLNETALGIVAPKFFVDSMLNTVSNRVAELALTSAKMFTAEEALKVGLIDDTATDKADAIEKCKKFIKLYDRIPPFARTAAKLSVRGPALKHLQQNRKQDLDIFVSFITDAKTQQALGMYIENLKKKASK